MEGDEEMDFNVRFDRMSKAMKTQLFIDNLTMIFNCASVYCEAILSKLSTYASSFFPSLR